MNNITTRTLVVGILSLAASVALSQNSQGQNGNNQGQSTGNPLPTVCRTCLRAPEINPAEAMGALTLLAGTVAIVRGYRRRQK